MDKQPQNQGITNESGEPASDAQTNNITAIGDNVLVAPITNNSTTDNGVAGTPTPQLPYSDLTPLINKDVFKNRRRMAWTSLYAMLIVMGILLFYIPGTNIENYTEVVSWFFMTMGGVIFAYMGTTLVPTFISKVRGKSTK